MGPRGMEISESSADIIKEQLPGEQSAAATSATDDDDDDDADEDEAGAPGTIAGYNTADILAAVTNSAEQGIALLTNWLGITTGAATGADDDEATANEAAIDAVDTTTPYFFSEEDWQNAESATLLPDDVVASDTSESA